MADFISFDPETGLPLPAPQQRDGVDNVIAAVDGDNPPPTPDVDSMIAAELAGSNITGTTGARRWDDVTEGSIVDGKPEIEMPPDDFSSLRTPQTSRVGEGSSGRVSTMRAGVAGGPKAVDGIFGGARRQAEQEIAANDPRFQQEAIRTGENFDNLREARKEITRLTSENFKWESEHYDRLDKFEQDQMKALQLIQQEGKAERARAMGDVQQQMMYVRQLVEQDPNPLHSLSTTNKLGLGAAAFAQGMLAVQGIKIDVTGQIDKWVDRSLQEHQNKIKNAQHGVQDQFHMYNIARQSSQDDIEAHMRYRTMFIEAAQVQVKAHAARFGSEMAMARAQEADVILQGQKDAAIAAIGDRRAKFRTETMKEALNWAKEEAHAKFQKEQNAIGWANNKVQQDKLTLDKKAAERAAMASSIKIQDPSQVQKDAKGNVISGGKYIATVDPNLPKDLYDKVYKRVSDAQEMYGEMHKNLDRLAQLKARADKGTHGPDWAKKKETEEYRLYDAQRMLTVASVRKFMSGTASTDKEGQQYLDLLQGDQWLQAGSNDKLISNMDHWGRKHFNSALQTPGVIAYDKEEYAPHIQVNPAGDAQEKIELSDSKPVKTIGNKLYKEAIDVTGGKDDPNDFYAKAPIVKGSASWKKLMGNEKAPSHYDSVDKLVEAYFNPQGFRKDMEPDTRNPWDPKYQYSGNKHNGSPGSIPDNDAALQLEAKNALKRFSEIKREGKDRDDSAWGSVPIYGARWYDMIIEDPVGAEKLWRSNRGAW